MGGNLLVGKVDGLEASRTPRLRLVGHSRSQASEAWFIPALEAPHVGMQERFGTPLRLRTLRRTAGALEIAAMSTPTLRRIGPAAMWALILLAPALAAKPSSHAPGLRNGAAPAASLLQLPRWASTSKAPSASAASYRPGGADTGPPTPGPTDPNGPSS